MAWSEEAISPDENLASVVSTAVANNPVLKASQARWLMFKNRAAQAGAPDDPVLVLRIQDRVVTDPLNFHKEPMPAKVIGLSQKLPFRRKGEERGLHAGWSCISPRRWTLMWSLV